MSERGQYDLFVVTSRGGGMEVAVSYMSNVQLHQYGWK